MIGATDKSWNSAITLYIAREIELLADGKQISVLDMGCGRGVMLEQLLDYGYDLYGYDFPIRSDLLRTRLSRYFGEAYEDRIRLVGDERSIPFEDDSFDVIYANQVFEHVKFFERMMSECARVLKPHGVLLANFPVATYPIEGHLKIPFAHWIPPGRLRVRYLQAFYASGVGRPRVKGWSALKMARMQDQILREQVYYRFMNEIENVAKEYFESLEIKTDRLVRAKLDMMAIDRNPVKRCVASLLPRCEGRLMNYLVTHFYNAAFQMKHPRKIGKSGAIIRP